MSTETCETPSCVSTQKDTVERLHKLDENAAELFSKLIKFVGVQTDRETGEYIEDRAYALLFGFGIPDLTHRLECQQVREQRAGTGQDAIARARIWRHIAEASKPMRDPKSGDGQIPDIGDGLVLNHWLPEYHEKFTRERPPRRCESCGMTWDCVEYHMTHDGSQQRDPNAQWFCWWCFKQPATRKHFGIVVPDKHSEKVVIADKWSRKGRIIEAHYETRDIHMSEPCVLCGMPWDCVEVGGHVLVKNSDKRWVCHKCAKKNRHLVKGSTAIVQLDEYAARR